MGLTLSSCLVFVGSGPSFHLFWVCFLCLLCGFLVRHQFSLAGGRFSFQGLTNSISILSVVRGQ